MCVTGPWRRRTSPTVFSHPNARLYVNGLSFSRSFAVSALRKRQIGVNASYKLGDARGHSVPAFPVVQFPPGSGGVESFDHFLNL